MAIKEHFEGKRDLGLIDPRKLTTDPDYNVRDLEKPDAREELDYLKSLIRVTGVQTPLRIREDDAGQLIIVRGHRRHKVVMELITEGHDIKLIPVTQEPRGTKPDERNWDLIDSNSEAPLKGFERAEVLYRQIHTFGWSEEKILERTGKTKQWLNAQLDLRAMPEPIKEHVRAGDISPTLARNIAKGADPVEAEKMIKANLEENARIKGKRTKVTAGTLKRDKPKPDPQPAPFVAEDEATAAQGKTPAADAAPAPDEYLAGIMAKVPPPAPPSGLPATQKSETPHLPLSDETPPATQPRSMQVVETEIATITTPRRHPTNRIDELLLEFISTDCPHLASMYANLCRELETTKSECGDASQAQEQLCVAADVIGALRFPDSWEGAKGNSELDQVA